MEVRWKPLLLVFGSLVVLIIVSGCQGESEPTAASEIKPEPTTTAPDLDLDQTLRQVLGEKGIETLEPAPVYSPELLALGEALFWDKELSGNRDIACATCHHPSFGTGDGLSVSVGTGGVGLGNTRLIGEGRAFIPRNAPEIFNRGDPEWKTMFWDSRVAVSTDQGFISPAGEALPEGLENILAVQAMFPIAARNEMRGEEGDLDVYGQPNEMAAITDGLPAIWKGMMQRLLSIPEYEEMFREAYPEIAVESLGYEYAANAIAAYEITTFTLLDSPWDRYLAGDDDALSDEAKQGAMLFYGEAGCSSCHSGNLMTDQQTHSIGVPQIGPGKNSDAALDIGRALETGHTTDEFAFRTPPLRNVAITGPWMHDGAYTTLEAAVRHNLNPGVSLRNYDYGQIDLPLREAHPFSDAITEDLIGSLDPLVHQPILLSDQEFDLLIAFLNALTSPSALNLRGVIPDSVPSGLPVGDERGLLAEEVITPEEIPDDTVAENVQTDNTVTGQSPTNSSTADPPRDNDGEPPPRPSADDQGRRLPGGGGRPPGGS